MIWTEQSQADLDDVWAYSKKHWGSDQADRYLAGLNVAISDRESRRRQARPIDFVSIGMARMRYARHFIYFREVAQSVLVVRVLHEAMDETLHLP